MIPGLFGWWHDDAVRRAWRPPYTGVRMPNYICKTCGAQQAESETPPEHCIICEDERQYIGRGGQQWTTLEEMRAEGRKNRVRAVDPGIDSIYTEPTFAIGQRTLLVQTPGGNFLWDMISYIDDETIAAIKERGGVHGIAISHPHFYGVAVEYAHAFGAPIYIPEADRQWFVRPDPAVRWFSGAVEALPGVTVVQVGGHFEGSTVLHWGQGAEGRGALLTGDSISVAADRRWVTFMRSYPNFIPLPAEMIRSVLAAIEPYAFDRIYGGWYGNDVREDARAAVQRSAERYIRWAEGRTDEAKREGQR